jgi:pyrroloquinoline-quinone synthase
MTKHGFFEQLDARIREYDLLCHPFYTAWAAGELTREDLREYGLQYLRHVEAFPAYLHEFATRVQDEGLRRAVLANRDEEAGANGSRPHAELWLDFVEGIGGQRSRYGAATIPEVEGLVAWFDQVARRGAPEEALAAFYAYESQVPRVASEKARGLRERYAADEKTCSYFSLHTTADVYHAQVWRNQLERLIEQEPAAAKRALAAAECAVKMLWKALDGIEQRRAARRAVLN